MSLYLNYEQRADDLRKNMRELVETAANEKREMAPAERDRYWNMQGEVETLESTARDLRNAETEELRGMAEKAVPTPAVDDAKEGRNRMSAFVREARLDGLKDYRSGEALAGTAENGGVLVAEPVHADFVDMLKEDLPILRLARFYDMTGADTVTIQRKTARAASGGIVGETATRGTTAAATYEEVSLKAYEYYANPRASQLFLDSVANAEQDIYADLLETMRQDYGADLITGTGVNAGNDALSKPQGLLVGVTQHIASGSASALTNTAVHNLIFSLASAYASKGVILGSRATLGVCDAFAHPASANIPLVTWQGGKPYILGKEFIECEDMPAIGAGAFPLVFGDIKSAYGCGVHRNWTMLRDPYTDKPFIHFYTIGRMGGLVRDPNAAVKLEVAAS